MNGFTSRFLNDVRLLVFFTAGLIVATLTLVAGNTADVLLQLAWLGFLLPGWLLCPRWRGEHVSGLRRYSAAMTSSVALYSTLSFLGVFLGVSVTAFVWVWFALIGVSAWDRMRVLMRLRTPSLNRLTVQSALLVAGLMIFAATVYRLPRSNDIHQFMLQQQDMLLMDSMKVSPIGMTALDVDEPMPRWRSNLWHLLPCMLARVTGVPVDQVLLRYATIPAAFTVLLSLVVMIRGLLGRRVGYGVVVLAMFGPVIFWYRNFHAFNYSFRLTNNFLLDKDFSLFFLIPAIAFLFSGVLNGRLRNWVPLTMLLPAIIRFHPMTAVYLVLLLPPLLIWKVPIRRESIVPLMQVCAVTAGCFVAVLLIGDAQGNHEQIQRIIRLDFDESRLGHPLHYWSGFYNTIENSGQPSDTTEWKNGTFFLNWRLLTGCALIAVMQLTALGGSVWILCRRFVWQTPFGRITLAAVACSGMLWGINLVSGTVLTRSPHLAAGFERLHWFCYLIGISVVAGFGNQMLLRFSKRTDAAVCVGVFATASLVVSGLLFHWKIPSPLSRVRVMNSLLDYELPGSLSREVDWESVTVDQSLDFSRPDYLRESDRVLLLDLGSTRHYWLTRQGVFWCDPYAEAFALARRGEPFLEDRGQFYGMLDRQPRSDFASWIRAKRITLIVDSRPEAQRFIDQLVAPGEMKFELVEPGVWRVRTRAL